MEGVHGSDGQRRGWGKWNVKGSGDRVGSAAVSGAIEVWVLRLGRRLVSRVSGNPMRDAAGHRAAERIASPICVCAWFVRVSVWTDQCMDASVHACIDARMCSLLSCRAQQLVRT